MSKHAGSTPELTARELESAKHSQLRTSPADQGGEQSMAVVLMGVSGAGKTEVGRLLAEELGWAFYDADDFHPPSNIEKMTRRQPLTDDDRRPWLQRLHELIQASLDSGSNIVLACSALKASYRNYLLFDARVRLVYLKGSFGLIHERLSHRHGHFMSAALLESQFEALEEPAGSITVDIAGTPREIVRAIRAALNR